MSPAKTSFSGLLRCVPALAALACAGTSFGQAALVGDSPFAPGGVAGSAGAAPAEAYELAGSSVQGSDISVCIFERQKKHAEWIPVGGDSDGVRVVSYDASRDTAVVIIAGARKELTMRKALVASLGAPANTTYTPPAVAPAGPVLPISSAAAPAAPATPANAAQEQREARMLVSDLLEIGVQQRKAYQDAKLKAASGTPAAPDN